MVYAVVLRTRRVFVAALCVAGRYADASVTTHVAKTVSACFADLRQIRSIRRSVTRPVLTSLVVSMVLTRLDCINAMPAGLILRLQFVLIAAARLACSARRHDQITPILRYHHWLRVGERIDFKPALRCIYGLAPSYLADTIHRAAELESKRQLKSSLSAALFSRTTRR